MSEFLGPPTKLPAAEKCPFQNPVILSSNLDLIVTLPFPPLTSSLSSVASDSPISRKRALKVVLLETIPQLCWCFREWETVIDVVGWQRMPSFQITSLVLFDDNLPTAKVQASITNKQSLRSIPLPQFWDWNHGTANSKLALDWL